MDVVRVQLDAASSVEPRRILAQSWHHRGSTRAVQRFWPAKSEPGRQFRLLGSRERIKSSAVQQTGRQDVCWVGHQTSPGPRIQQHGLRC